MLLEDIYQGKVFLQEMIKPKCSKYKEMLDKKHNLSEKIKESLTDEQIELLNKYTNVMFDIEEEHAMSAFIEGVKFGAKLYKEMM